MRSILAVADEAKLCKQKLLKTIYRLTLFQPVVLEQKKEF